jgi:hypothetical protein
MAGNYGLSKIFGVQKAKEIHTRIHFHKTINLTHPRKLNEKILWTEYNTDGQMRTRLTDKYEVRKFVEQKGYKETLVPLLGVYDKAEEIPFDELPEKFVLKATHGCDMNYLCTDKKQLDQKEQRELRKMIRFWLSFHMAYMALETHYRDIRRRIICEKYIEAESGLPDYKFHCSNGKVRFILVCNQKGAKRYKNVFDRDWKELDVVEGTEVDPEPVKRPDKLEEMIQMAEKLAEGIPFVRVDLYQADGKIYFGEMTFTPATGVLFHFKDTFLEEEGKYCVTENKRCGYEKDSSGRGRVRRSC